MSAVASAKAEGLGARPTPHGRHPGTLSIVIVIIATHSGRAHDAVRELFSLNLNRHPVPQRIAVPTVETRIGVGDDLTPGDRETDNRANTDQVGNGPTEGDGGRRWLRGWLRGWLSRPPGRLGHGGARLADHERRRARARRPIRGDRQRHRRLTLPRPWTDRQPRDARRRDPGALSFCHTTPVTCDAEASYGRRKTGDLGEASDAIRSSQLRDLGAAASGERQGHEPPEDSGIWRNAEPGDRGPRRSRCKAIASSIGATVSAAATSWFG